MTMPTGAIIGSVAGGVISGAGSWFTGKQQAKAAKGAAAAQAAGYGRARDDYMSLTAGARPYWDEATAAGKGAITSLAQLYGIATPGNPNPSPAYSEGALANFRRSPEYTFAEDEGRKQLEAAYSKAYGGIRGGNQMRGFVEFGQGLAGTTLGNYFNRVMSLAHLGQGAAGQQAQGAAGLANLQVGQGNAAAQGILGAGQANAAGMAGLFNNVGQGISGAGNNYLLMNTMKSAYGNQTPYGWPTSGVDPTGFDPSLPWKA